MSAPVRVHTTIPAFRAAAAELSRRARDAEGPKGAVAVLPGTRRWDRAVQTAVDAGARAVVIDQPALLDADSLEAVSRLADAVPIVLLRARLRPDAVAGAAAIETTPAFVVVECHAPANVLDATLADALGWVRSLVGASMPRTLGTEGGRSLALLDAAGLPVTLVAAPTSRTSPTLLRVTLVGETRIEVSADGASTAVRWADASGEGTQPPRRERAERVALRRAIDALAENARPRDVAELSTDAALVAAIRAGAPVSPPA